MVTALVRRMGADQGHGGITVGGDDDIVAMPGEGGLQRPPNLGLVIDDQDTLIRHRDSRPRSRGAA